MKLIPSLLLASCFIGSALADVVVTTADPDSFDGFLREIDGGGNGSYFGNFVSTGNWIRSRQFGPADASSAVRHYVSVLKFDLTGVNLTGPDLIGANLTLTVEGRSKGTPTPWKLGYFTGDDSLITTTMRYEAANPLIDDNYLPETDPDIDFAPGAVEQLVEYTRGPIGATDVIGAEEPAFLAAVRAALDGDKAITFLIYRDGPGNSDEYYMNSSTAASGRPTLTLNTIPEPFLAIDPPEAFEADELSFTWYAPPGAENLSISPDIGDVSAETNENGVGALTWSAPAADTTYTLNYNLEGSPFSFPRDIAILPPQMSVTPDSAIANITPLAISWRIKPEAEIVTLDFGPGGGPFESIDVTGFTSFTTGEGNYTGFIPQPGETHYRIRYSNGGNETILTDSIEVISSVYDQVIVTGNTTAFEIDANLVTGSRVFTDRTFTWSELPEVVQGGQLIRPGTTDRTSPSFQMELSTIAPVTLFLLIDNRVGDPLNIKDEAPTLGNGIMDWVSELGFLDSGLEAWVDETGDTAGDTPCSVFFLQLAAGQTITLGAQNNGTSRVMYSVVAVSPQVQLDGFGAAPNRIVEYRSTTLRWAVPPGSTVSIDPDAGNVTAQTDPVTGIGSAQVSPPGTGFVDYTLTYDPPGAAPPVELGPVTVEITPAPEPTFTLTPDNGWEGDILSFSWQVPAPATNLAITPVIGSVTADTDPLTGAGFTTFNAPPTDTTFTLTYSFEGDEYTLDQDYTANPLGVTVSPRTAIAGDTPLNITWRIAPQATLVFLDSGPDGGPYDSVDVTSQTDFSSGAGTLSGFVPTASQSHYRIRYTVGGSEFILTDSITVVAGAFSNVSGTGNTRPVEISPDPLTHGVPAYNDRTHTWALVPPALEGGQFLRFGNDDRNNANFAVSFSAATDATYFLMIDNRVGDGVGGQNPQTGLDNPPTLGNGVMDWVLTSGFVDSGLDIGLDEGNNGVINNTFSIFFRQATAGETFNFLAQADGTSRSLYGVVAVAPRVIPESFIGSPAVIDQGGSLTFTWTVAPGSTVTIDQGVGNVTATTDPLTGVGIAQVVPTATGNLLFTLTYTPPGGGSPVSLAPVAITINPVAGGGDSFPISGIAVNPGTGAVSFSWSAPAGITEPGNLTDTVERSTTLGSWDLVPSGDVTIVDGVVNFTDPSPPAGGKAFYRVVRP